MELGQNAHGSSGIDISSPDVPLRPDLQAAAQAAEILPAKLWAGDAREAAPGADNFEIVCVGSAASTQDRVVAYDAAGWTAERRRQPNPVGQGDRARTLAPASTSSVPPATAG